MSTVAVVPKPALAHAASRVARFWGPTVGGAARSASEGAAATRDRTLPSELGRLNSSTMPVYISYLERGTTRKFWKAELRDRVVSTTWGALGASPSATKKTYRHRNAAEVALNKELAQRAREGYYAVSASELASLRKAAKVPPAASSASRAAGSDSQQRTARASGRKKKRKAS